jgi:hypothetical protein
MMNEDCVLACSAAIVAAQLLIREDTSKVYIHGE